MSKNTRGLTIFEGITIVTGIVIGAGIFKTPSLVAQNCVDTTTLILAWIGGGVISFTGALCYAELSSTYPGRGGDYHFLFRAYGYRIAFLFGWARLMVIQTGSIAMMGFLIGDYASEVVNLGMFSSSIYAAGIICVFTLTNIFGIHMSSVIQKILFILVISGLIYVVYSGFFSTHRSIDSSGGNINDAVFGKAMIFVLLTYGGWNEAAFLSAEVKKGGKSIIKVFLYSILIITFLYLLINLALVRAMGLGGLAGSTVAAADLMADVNGRTGVSIISVLVVLASMGTINAAILTGGRSAFILGEDFAFFRRINLWDKKKEQPVRALLLQAFVAILLVITGTGSRDGFVLMVEYTAPVFWLFFLLSGLSLFRLRKKNHQQNNFFKVPLYPFTPLLFCFISFMMLYSSVLHSGIGALAGLGVLLSGLLLSKRRK